MGPKFLIKLKFVISHISCNPHLLCSVKHKTIVVMSSIALNSASRALNLMEYASQTLFQRHTALLVANNAVCLISGFDLRI